MVEIILAINKISWEDIFGCQEKEGIIDVLSSLRENIGLPRIIAVYNEVSVYSLYEFSVLIRSSYIDPQHAREAIEYFYKSMLYQITTERFRNKVLENNIFGFTVCWYPDTISAAIKARDLQEERVLNHSNKIKISDEYEKSKIIIIPFHPQEGYFEKYYIEKCTEERLKKIIGLSLDGIIVFKPNVKIAYEFVAKNPNIELILAGIRDEKYPVKDDDQKYIIQTDEARDIISKYHIRYVLIGRPILEGVETDKREIETRLRYFKNKLS